MKVEEKTVRCLFCTSPEFQKFVIPSPLKKNQAYPIQEKKKMEKKSLLCNSNILFFVMKKKNLSKENFVK
jgi:hypothetical protein